MGSRFQRCRSKHDNQRFRLVVLASIRNTQASYSEYIQMGSESPTLKRAILHAAIECEQETRLGLNGLFILDHAFDCDRPP